MNFELFKEEDSTYWARHRGIHVVAKDLPSLLAEIHLVIANFQKDRPISFAIGKDKCELCIPASHSDLITINRLLKEHERISGSH